MKINNLTMTGTPWWPVFCDSLSGGQPGQQQHNIHVFSGHAMLFADGGNDTKVIRLKLLCGWGENTEYLDGSSLTIPN